MYEDSKGQVLGEMIPEIWLDFVSDGINR